ncbi:phospho-N-acetylmuramoyl-pentapeptide-transferase [Anaerolentibacter hominis]|uniref:phospho-N-acetylmuramoyl-pentapeptide- transferase n=1 Tax=Anaerolentibacter hominis TaxID=3079009 RepID=UPI0031B8375C
MLNQVIVPVILSFFVSVLLSPIFIPFLHKLKFGQFIREEGPQSHQKKSGTPTMGGLIILLSVIVTSLVFMKGNPDIIPVLFVTIGFGIIGFLDDYIKVVMKRNLGLKAWQKMLAQIVVTGVFGYYILHYTDLGTTVLVPFTHGTYWNLGGLFLPFLFVVVLGTVNGVNFTDGLDGLASGVTVLVATFFTVVAVGMNMGLSVITSAVAGALLGFLVYNVYPAKIFMGDTGSLALGGFVVGTAFMLRMPLFILIVGFIYFAEILSVMLQVTYFKLTHGKRIFKMAPIHHHFELCGWSETRVVTVFSIVTALLCLVGFYAI